MNETSNSEAFSIPDWNFGRKSGDVSLGAGSITYDQNSQSTLQGSPTKSKFQDALSFLIQLYRAFGSNVASDELNKLVDTYSSKIILMQSKTESETKESLLKIDIFSCPSCFSVVHDPHTIRCGHTYCKKCMQKEVPGSQCKLCNYKFASSDIMHTKPNVLLLSLTERLWPNDGRAISLRNEGNDLCAKKKREEALKKYTEAVELSPFDHLSLGNRSITLLALGKSDEALTDSEAAIKNSPFWPKGYFRKAVTLISMGRYEEAFTTLTLCIYLTKATKTLDEAAMNPVKAEMVKVLNKLFQSSSSYGQPALRRHTLDHVLFSPYPSQKRKYNHNDRQWVCGTWSESEFNSSGDETESGPREGLNVTQSSRRSGLRDSSHLAHHKGSASFGGGQDQTVTRINRLFSRALQELTSFENRLKSMPTSHRSIDEALISGSDFECSLCYRLIYQPVTTTCGHTYCRSCLERCLDHSPMCPLCKNSLEDFLACRRHSITHILDLVISKFLPKEHSERINQHLEELAGGGASEKSKEIEIPIFVCTMAFPTVPCPLHIFEPRYRLMVRRCMESGTKRFGMCCYLQEGVHNYGDFGTLLEIRSVQYFPDGRSVVDTVGVRRFKVVSKSLKDGYNTASIEFVQDRPVEDSERSKLEDSHENVFKEANEWLQSISQVLRQRIYTHFGQMPSPEEDWIEVPNGPSWAWWLLAILPLDAKAQLAILSMNSLQKRLESINKVLRYVKSRLT